MVNLVGIKLDLGNRFCVRFRRKWFIFLLQNFTIQNQTKILYFSQNDRKLCDTHWNLTVYTASSLYTLKASYWLKWATISFGSLTFLVPKKFGPWEVWTPRSLGPTWKNYEMIFMWGPNFLGTIFLGDQSSWGPNLGTKKIRGPNEIGYFSYSRPNSYCVSNYAFVCAYWRAECVTRSIVTLQWLYITELCNFQGQSIIWFVNTVDLFFDWIFLTLCSWFTFYEGGRV